VRHIFEEQVHQFVAGGKKNRVIADAIPTTKGPAIRAIYLNNARLLLNDQESGSLAL